jgi:two-component system response regulator YesN
MTGHAKRTPRLTPQEELLQALRGKLLPWIHQGTLPMMTADLPLQAPDAIRISPRRVAPLKARKSHHNRSAEPEAFPQIHWEKERMRAIPNPLLIFVLEGTADIEIGVTEEMVRRLKLKASIGQYIARLPAGSMLLVPPNVPSADGSRPHWLGENTQEARSQILWLNLLPEGAMIHICSSHGIEHHAAPRHFLLDGWLLTMGELLIEELNRKADTSASIARAHLTSLLLHVERDLATGTNSPDSSGEFIVTGLPRGLTAGSQTDHNSAAIMQRACHYIANHLSEPLTAAHIAHQSYASSSHLNRLFRAELDVSLMKYVEQSRLKTAQSLLTTTNLPVAVIGRYVGYPHVAHFSLMFKRNAGVSPLQYRRQEHLKKAQTADKRKPVNESRNS